MKLFEPIEIGGDFPPRAIRRSLEDHVLQKVRDAGDFRRFVSCTGANEETGGRTSHVRHLLDDDAEAVFQCV